MGCTPAAEAIVKNQERPLFEHHQRIQPQRAANVESRAFCLGRRVGNHRQADHDHKRADHIAGKLPVVVPISSSRSRC